MSSDDDEDEEDDKKEKKGADKDKNKDKDKGKGPPGVNRCVVCARIIIIWSPLAPFGPLWSPLLLGSPSPEEPAPEPPAPCWYVKNGKPPCGCKPGTATELCMGRTGCVNRVALKCGREKNVRSGKPRCGDCRVAAGLPPVDKEEKPSVAEKSGGGGSPGVPLLASSVALLCLCLSLIFPLG